MIKKLLFLVFTTGITSLSAQNLILNGNFEAGTGDIFTNWKNQRGS
ncbi:hypothetical protein [Flavobacterium ajazii]|nr:hypothetical protein [Flavobacterium ajazii]